MQFNDTTNKTGICQDVWFLTGTDSTSFPTADIARLTNKVLRELALDAWRFSNAWDFDDRNHTTLNIATCSLVDGQSDYSLASTDFDIQRVEVENVNGIWSQLELIKVEDIPGAIDEFYKEKGVPEYYYLKGGSIFLKPAPDTTLVSTLKIYLSRDISEFNSTDTDKEPGLPTVLHPIIPYLVALEYAGMNGLTDKIAYLKSKADEWRQRLVNYFATRGKNKAKLTPKYSNFE